MKVIQLKQLNPSGYKRYDKFDQDQTSAIKIISSRFFTYSTKKAEHFVKALETLYANQNAKIILDVVATHILKNDSLIITYGFGCGSKLGHYVFNPVKTLEGVPEKLIEKHTAILDAEKKALASEIINLILKLQTGADGSAPSYETIDISAQRLHDKIDHLSGTILHEMSHLALDILFENKSLGFNTDDEYIIAENSFYESILLLLAIMDPLGYDYYPSINIETLSSILHKNVNALDSQMDESLHLEGFDVTTFKETLKAYKESGVGRAITVLSISDNSYPSSFLINSELFARFCQLFASQEKFPLIDNLLGKMEPYYSEVLAPKIIEYMKKHAEQANLLGIKTEDIKFQVGSSQLSAEEKAFFCLVKGDTTALKNLCTTNQIDPNKKVFGLYKLGHLATLQKNTEALALLSKDSAIDLSTKDALSLNSDVSYSLEDAMDEMIEEQNIEVISDLLPQEIFELIPDEILPEPTI